MSVKDMIKKSVLESDNFVQSVSWDTMSGIIINMLLAVLLGVCIYLVYKKFYNGVIYSRSYALTLVGMTCLTCMVTLAISTNIVISLGMVGALSIVRFRTPVKEAMDIVFLFWAIAVGIVLAAGLLMLAFFGSLFIGIVMLVISTRRNPVNPYILVLHCDNEEVEEETRKLVSSNARALKLKSKTVLPGSIELNYEIRLKEDRTSFVNDLSQLSGVNHVALVSYNGDYMG